MKINYFLLELTGLTDRQTGILTDRLTNEHYELTTKETNSSFKKIHFLLTLVVGNTSRQKP